MTITRPIRLSVTTMPSRRHLTRPCGGLRGSPRGPARVDGGPSTPGSRRVGRRGGGRAGRRGRGSGGSPGRVGVSRRVRHRCRSADDGRAAGEVVAPLAVGRVPVEDGAARRQHHGVARAAASAAARPRRRPWSAAHGRTGARPAKTAATSSAASPMATTARSVGAASRQRRTGRGPCCGRRRSAPRGRTRRRAASGGVRASSPWSRRTSARRRPRATSCTRWGRPAKARSSRRATPSSGARRRARWPRAARALATSWGRAGGSSSTAQQVGAVGADAARRRAHVAVRAGRVDRPKVDGARAGARPQVAGHDRVVDVADGDVVGAPGRPRCGPWPPRRRPGRACTSRWSGAKLSQVATPGPEARAVAQPERGRLDHEHLDGGVVEGGDERHVGVARRRRRATPDALEHVGDHHRHRGLAVGAGDGDDRAVVPRARPGRTR